MSLDGGYIGSLDHAIANLHVGRNQGRRQGIEEGLEEGYQRGYHEGHVNGWNEATTVANGKLREQLAYTHQHFVEKEKIKEELAKQRDLINQLEAKVVELEQENTKLRGENTKLRKSDRDLRGLVEALKGANERLQEQVTSLDTKFREKSEQYVDQLWQHNRSIVFMNSVRNVLEDLTNEDTPIATRVRRLFAERYAEQVSEALGKGGIKTPPEKDEKFAKSLPQTRQFILDMLNSVGQKKELSVEEPEEDWVP